MRSPLRRSTSIAKHIIRTTHSSQLNRKRQYGYRLNEKWGWKKYGEKRDSTLLPSPQNEASHGGFLSLSTDHLNAAAFSPNPYLNVPSKRSSARAPSNASETSTASGYASYMDETDAEDAVSTSGTLLPHIYFAWGPQDDAKKLMADFCSFMSDDENAFALYHDLNSDFSNVTESSIIAKNLLVTYICRAADRPKNAKLAREILSRHRAAISGSTYDRPFMFSVLDAILKDEEDTTGRAAVNRQICNILETILIDDTTVCDIPHSYSAVDLLTRRLLCHSLEIYEEALYARNNQPPTFSREKLTRQYLSKQPITGTVEHGGGSVLRDCISWCARQLTLNCKIPNEVASIGSGQRQIRWYDCIKLYCTLWHNMLLLVQNECPPRWYVPCESALGIPPSELLGIVCWMVGDVVGQPGSRNDILQRARPVADAMLGCPDKDLWDKFYERFDWMNRTADGHEDDEVAFETVVCPAIRRYISATLSSPLPYPAKEYTSLPSSSMDIDCDYPDAMPLMENTFE
ncbi:hypothetical protein B0T10DRAFT_213184 [Thelonectria olida]|uniref:Uncharacterized protein n=1 Tax=Thelonectria olida TaxID=1576542 RepID=A0A9P8WC28_9HYPO|nr:hypothetical protein B0T10DRAFT_213184 [Thelonectria olida]